MSEIMDPVTIIKIYYKEGSDLYNMLINHSTDVMNKALSVVDKHPELKADRQFVAEAAMLHDIGILHTYAPLIHCYGLLPYPCHGYLGREILDGLGYPAHGLVCERHTGVGITEEDIISQGLPLPHRDMVPITVEEMIICFADCFFSKTKLGVEKPIEKIRQELSVHGEDKAIRFDDWCRLFL